MFSIHSQITIKILNFFFLNPTQKLYINEMAEKIKVDPGNLFRKLKELEIEGVLVSEIRGREKFFGLNKNYPLLKEIKKTFEAKYGLPNLLKQKLTELKGLKESYIFGSFAKNSLQQESDIDLLLIGEHKSLDAKRIILPLQKIIGREINIIDLKTKEFVLRRRQKDAFIKNIFSQPRIKLF